jgi:hypothetical protein
VTVCPLFYQTIRLLLHYVIEFEYQNFSRNDVRQKGESLATELRSSFLYALHWRLKSVLASLPSLEWSPCGCLSDHTFLCNCPFIAGNDSYLFGILNISCMHCGRTCLRC